MHVSRKHPAMFYGWWVVISTASVMLFTSGVIHFGFTAIFEPIAQEFGWSYAQISLAASLRGLETGLLAPAVGLLVDRWGPRRLIAGGVIISGLGLILLSHINSLAMFYGAFVLIAIGTSATGHAVTMAAVANWFQKRISLAVGIMASGAALGGLLVPLLVVLIDAFGWRMAMYLLGLGTWAICLPLSLLVRHHPEQYGCLPDGEESSGLSGGESPTTAHSVEVDIPAREAIKHRAFWHITLSLTFQALVMSAVLTHIMPYLSSIGMARSASGLVASALPLASIIGRLSFGWLGDRLDKRRVAAVGFALTGVGLLLFGYAGSIGMWLLMPFLVVYGTGWGGNVTMRAALLREYFGRERFGTIHGFTLGVMTLGNIAGAPFAGWVFDQWHSYQGAWFTLAALSTVAIFIVTTTPRAATKPSS